MRVQIIEATRVTGSVFAAVAITAILIGCAGTDGKNARLAASELAARGGAICRAATAEEQGIHATSTRVALPRIKVIAEHELSELKKLAPPANERTSYRALLGYFSQLDGLLPALSHALQKGTSPASLLARGRRLASRAQALVGPLALTDCSRSTSAG